MFERKYEKIAPVAVFIRRLAASIAMAGILVSIVLFIGIAGYHWIAGFDWTDSILEASMILGGMGPLIGLRREQQNYLLQDMLSLAALSL